MQNKIIPTQLDYTILGLLRNEPATGYKVRKTFEETALGNYSSSPGTIYPALKRLKFLELAEYKLEPKSSKKLYFITPLGLIKLKEWLATPITKKDIQKRNNELILRFAFMEGILSSEQVLIFLETYQNLTQNYLQELKKYYVSQLSDLPLLGRLAFEHGLMFYQANLDWCINTITIIKSNNL